MPRLTKIYTRTGDDGTTALGTRKRAAKDSLRVAAYGDVDELNSVIGLAIAQGLSPLSNQALTIIQNDLFNLGSVLAFPEDEETSVEIPQIEERHIMKLELLIDEVLKELETLANFILPGGTLAAAQLHHARSICRRAERSVVSLKHEEEIGENVLSYLNRLSDALFVLARFENKMAGFEEQLWDSYA
jgi:cob(I)alamin adenosyltransferase